MAMKLTAIIVSIVLMAIVFSTGCTSNTGNTTPYVALNMTKYDSGNFTIQYPSEWKLNHTSERLTDVVVDNFIASPGTNVNVQATSHLTKETFSSSTISRVSNLQSINSFKQIDAGNATLAGNPAYKIVYTWLFGGCARRYVLRT